MTVTKGMPAVAEMSRVVMRKGSLPWRVSKTDNTYSHCCDTGGRIGDLCLLENVFNPKKVEEGSKAGIRGNPVL